MIEPEGRQARCWRVHGVKGSTRAGGDRRVDCHGDATRGRAKASSRVGGQARYGWRVAPSRTKLVPHAIEQDVRELVRQLRSDGLSLRDVAAGPPAWRSAPT